MVDLVVLTGILIAPFVAGIALGIVIERVFGKGSRK
jgi:hypothetical protein